MLKFDRFGDQLWMSTASVSVVVGPVCSRHKTGLDRRGRKLGPCDRISRRAVQYHIDKLVELEVLQQVYPANCRVRYRGTVVFRHTATYALNADKLAERESWEAWKASMPVAKPFKAIGPQSVTQPMPPPAPTSPAPAPPARDHRASTRAPRRLTPREGPALVAKMLELMRGNVRVVGLDGLGRNLDPGDPRYRAPMSQDAALISACMALGIPHDAALEHLKLCRWTPPGDL